jgi:transposase
MEQQKQEFYAPRENKQSRYDKRLILKIVREVEAGLPRKEANRIYELGKSSLDGWMKNYGSPEYKENMRRKSYTYLQKRTVVTAIEQGWMSIKEAQTAYGVKTEKIIRNWLAQYKKEKVKICIITEPVMAATSQSFGPAQAEALQKALQEAELTIKALNTLIDAAKEQLTIDIRKKSGAKQSTK